MKKRSQGKWHWQIVFLVFWIMEMKNGCKEKVLHLPNHEQHTTHQPIIIDFSYFLWVCMFMQPIGNKFLCPPPWSSLRVVLFFEMVDFRWSCNQNWKILGLEKQLLCLTWVPPVLLCCSVHSPQDFHALFCYGALCAHLLNQYSLCVIF